MSTKWPGTELVLGSAPSLSPGDTVELLGSSGQLQWEMNEARELKITLPRRDESTSKWAWTLVITLNQAQA